MKPIVTFSKFFIPAGIVSAVLLVSGIVGFVVNGGFNLGVDFQAGLIQEIQFAPTAFDMTYTGRGNASVTMDQSKLDIVVSGSDVERATFSFPYASYGTMGALTDALSRIEGLSIALRGNQGAASADLIQSTRGDPRLGSLPYTVHYLSPGSEPITIDRVRSALENVGSIAVQVLGRPEERKFLIRVEDKGEVDGFAMIATEQISDALDAAFGPGEVAIARTDYVGARFSRDLTDQAGLLVVMTLLLIMVYASIRFKIQYALGAVLAIGHDALIMVAFIAWSRMEFNTVTIAAILTILGYSINDTIVIFDRIRETVRLYPEDSFELNMNRAITETLGRTVITTVTTMLAVMSLFIFTTGSMKDFALALLIGMVSGTYSTIFIASSTINFLEKVTNRRASRKLLSPAPVAKKA